VRQDQEILNYGVKQHFVVEPRIAYHYTLFICAIYRDQKKLTILVEK
jgi:hypothetical protein